MDLRKELTKLAKKEASLRKHILPLLRKDAHKKTAIQQETRDFIDYIFTSTNGIPRKENEVLAMLKQSKIPQKPPKTRTGPRFNKGDELFINMSKAKGNYMGQDPVTGDPIALTPYDCQRCNCIAASASAVTIEVSDGTTILCPWGQKATGIPLFKFFMPFTMKGSPMMEIIYLAADKNVTDNQQVQALNYLGRGGAGEQRSLNYYTGSCFGWRYNKEGQVYFDVHSQQRYQIEGTSCGPKKPWDAFGVRSFNPTDGKVLYIGLLGHRLPANWQQEFAKLKAKAMSGND